MPISIIGNVESDYLFDMDMTDSTRPDFAVVRKQLIEYGTFLAEIEPKLNAQGKKVNWSEITKGIGKTFDTIPDTEVIVEDMTEEEMASQQEQQALAETQETLKGASQPTEEALIRGAENVGMAQGLTLEDYEKNLL